MFSSLEIVMGVLTLALVSVVVTIGLTLGWPGAMLVAVMGAFGLACLAGAVGLGGHE